MLLFAPLQAFGSSDVIINEIAWMGTEKSANDEWIELYNKSSSLLPLDGWTLKSATGTLKISLQWGVPPKGFYLLERTDDDAVPGINADLIYSGALKNTGEKLELYDNLNNLMDSADFSEGWTAGDNKTKQTMERTDSGWQTSQESGGTPKAENSIVVQPQEETRPKAETGKPVEAKTQQTYPSGVIFNEILPSPKGSDAEEEWIEIFNQNDFEISLSGWQISDTTGAVKIHPLPENTKISPKGFLVLSRPTTQITLNNFGDGLKLVQPDGKETDSINYENAPVGESYNREGSVWLWSSSLTPGLANQIAPQEENKKDGFQEKQNDLENDELAAISKPFEETGNEQSKKSNLVPLSALLISLFSGIVILTLKKRVKSTD